MEAVGSNGGHTFSSPPPSSNTTVLDVKPLRVLAPYTPQPFMPMPGFPGPNGFPYMFYPNPYAPFPPTSSTVPPTASASAPPAETNRIPEPVTPHSDRNTTETVPEPISVVPISSKKPSLFTPQAGSSKKASGSKSKSSTKKSLGRKEKTIVQSTPRPKRASTQAMVVGDEKQVVGSPSSSIKRSHKKRKGNLMVESPDLVEFLSNKNERELIEKTLLLMGSLKLWIIQQEEGRKLASGGARPDMKVMNLMMSKGVRLNEEKKIGSIPGVQVGDVFTFRTEMCVLGFHAPTMGGIDYMTKKFGDIEEPIAISIVSSGGYEGDKDEGDVLIYSGQGGAAAKDGTMTDQKLVRGNLALERSFHHKIEIRVTRGIKDPSLQMAKVYVYDGLYTIEETWAETVAKGNVVFKFKLVRVPGQLELGSTIWNNAMTWKENPPSRKGVVLADLSLGREKIPVCLVNEVDDEKGPAHFFYVIRVMYLKSISMMTQGTGCKCNANGACSPSNMQCNCNILNDSECPYTSAGFLVYRKSMIYECGPSCLCPTTCPNRVSQRGTALRFEVFKTPNRGWGLRSWDFIRAGSFVCEFTGEVVAADGIIHEYVDDEYIFEANRIRQKTLNCDNIYDLLGEPRPPKCEEHLESLPIVIDAKKSGNMSRFINHSCSPNLYWQPVLYDHFDEKYPHVMFFAIKNIPPMQELTYDYGLRKSDGKDSTPHPGRKQCLCGAYNCKGFFD